MCLSIRFISFVESYQIFPIVHDISVNVHKRVVNVRSSGPFIALLRDVECSSMMPVEFTKIALPVSRIKVPLLYDSESGAFVLLART